MRTRSGISSACDSAQLEYVKFGFPCVYKTKQQDPRKKNPVTLPAVHVLQPGNDGKHIESGRRAQIPPQLHAFFAMTNEDKAQTKYVCVGTTQRAPNTACERDFVDFVETVHKLDKGEFANRVLRNLTPYGLMTLSAHGNFARLFNTNNLSASQIKAFHAKWSDDARFFGVSSY